MDEWVKAAWQAAEQLGLTDRWEFWVGLALLLALTVLARRLGPPVLLYLRTVKPPPAVDGDGNLPPGEGSPPMPLDRDGSLHLDQKPPEDHL